MKESNPEVSVIIPTYNRARLIARAIRTILNQTYQDFEVIVVDDGSTDNTEVVVKGFGDPRIRYIKYKENKGPAFARNRGIEASKGRIIAFQDSDNQWHREKLAKQMELLKNAPRETGVIYTGIWRIKDDKKIYIPHRRISKKEGNVHEALFITNFIDLPAAIVRKECFSKVGLFDELLPGLEDWELWIRISKYYHFKYLNEPLVNAYYVSDSISIDYDKLIIALEYILTKHFDKFKKRRESLAKNYIGLAHLLCSYSDIEKGRNYLIKALKEYPLNIKSLLYIVFSFFGQNVYGYFYRNLSSILKWSLKSKL